MIGLRPYSEQIKMAMQKPRKNLYDLASRILKASEALKGQTPKPFDRNPDVAKYNQAYYSLRSRIAKSTPEQLAEEVIELVRSNEQEMTEQEKRVEEGDKEDYEEQLRQAQDKYADLRAKIRRIGLDIKDLFGL